MTNEKIEIRFQRSPFVTDGEKSRRCCFGAVGFDPIKCRPIVLKDLVCNFTAYRIIRMQAVGICN